MCRCDTDAPAGIAKLEYGTCQELPNTNAKKYSTGPKFKLNLRIFMTHLYPEFQFKMSIYNGDNERKLKINGIFLSPRA